MATKQEIRARAKQLITETPTAGKERINKQLRIEFGKGLRSSTVLKLKAEVATEKPSLYPLLYATGSVPKALNEIYKGWIRAGFLAFEARELTLGHGGRYRAFDAKAIFESKPGQLARDTRTKMIREQLHAGLTKKQIRQNIIDFYLRSKRVDPWEHIRAEYKPRKKTDYKDYKSKARRRAKSKQSRLLGNKDIWIIQLRESAQKAKTIEQRKQFEQQIRKLGGTP